MFPPRRRADMTIETTAFRRWIGAILITGVVLTAIVAGLTYRGEERQRHRVFLERAQSRVMVASSIWAEFILPIQAAQSFHRASAEVSRDEFSVFTQTFLGQNLGVSCFAWVPAVLGEAISRHESYGRSEGLERYQVKALLPSLKGKPALSSTIFFPLFYVEPFWGHEDLLGLDLASDDRILGILQEAGDQNLLTARIHPDWIRPGVFSNGICIVAPVYSKAGQTFTPADRRNHLTGFVLVVYDVTVLLNRAFSLPTKQSLDCAIDIVADGGAENLYVWFSRTRSPEEKTKEHLLGDSAYRYERTLQFLDMGLRLRCTPAPNFFKENPIWKTKLVVGLGLVLTLFLGYGLILAIRRDRRIQQLVEERTAQLREKTEFMNTFLAAIPLAVFYKDTEGRYLGMNVAFEKLYGLEPGEGLGKTVFDIVSGATAELYHAKDLELLKHSGFQTYESTLVDKQGKERHYVFHKATFANGQGKVQGLVGAIVDVTEQKQTLDRIRRIFSAVDGYSDSVLLVDEKGRPIYANMAFGDRFNVLPEAVGRIGLATLFRNPQQGESILAGLMASVPWEGEVQMKSTDGTVFPALLRGAPTIGDRFEVAGYSLILADLTERKKLEGQLLHMQKMESVGHLAAGIAHEINTPIQFVGDNLCFLQEGFGDLLGMVDRCWTLAKEDRGDRQEREKVLAAIEADSDVVYLRKEVPRALEQSREGVRRVAEIVRAMKEFSHPGGKEKTTVDVNRCIETTLTISRNEWKYVAEAETHLAGDLPPVPGWPGDLNQVLLNLIVNAAHAILEAKRGEEGGKGLIVLASAKVGEFVEIRVTDNGVGIPEQNREHVFSPFFTTKGVGKGTGQGLALAYNVVVKKHGGAIWFESKVGEGTTFFVRLPMISGTTGEAT